MANKKVPDVDHLLRLVEEECTAEQVANLLREFKDDNKKKVFVTAESKSELIDVNLRRAIAEDAVPVDRVWNLVREAEENGSQHVFYYLPKREILKLVADHKLVRASLLDAHTLNEGDIPRSLDPSLKYVLADFHTSGGDSPEAAKWVAKFYGQEQYREKAGKERHERDIILIPYKEVKKRTVLVAVYRGWGVLELRIPRIESAPLVGEMLEKLWEAIGPVLPQDSFTEWDFTPARRKLLAESDQHHTMYALGATLLNDGSGGTCVISPHGDDDDLFAAKARENAVKAYLAKDCGCRNLRVVWLAQPKLVPPVERTVTVIGAARKSAPGNEVVVTGKTSAGTMDYVAYRLRDFQK